MRGPLPKPEEVRARRNRKSSAATLKPVADPQPPPLPSGRRWHEETRSWWRVIWESPAASQWTDADAAGLLRLARLIDGFNYAESVDQLERLIGEIRLQEERYGLSPAGRARLGWRSPPPADEATTQPSPRLVVVDEDPRRCWASRMAG